MRAVTFDGRLAVDGNHPEPQAGEGECQVRVHLAGISAADLRIAAGGTAFRGVLGHEMVGTVVSGAPAWRGKRVVCDPDCVCRRCDLCLAGLSRHCRKRLVMGVEGRDGCFADRVAVAELNLHEVPDAVTDEEAVFVDLLASACHILTQCRVEPRWHVSVVGAGRLGLVVAELLKSTCCNLTVIGHHIAQLLVCEKKGIQAIPAAEVNPKQDRDLVVECSGTAGGLGLALGMIRPRGTIVVAGTQGGKEPLDLRPLIEHELRFIGTRRGSYPEALHCLARQAVDVRALVSRIYAIEQAVDAFAAAQRPENMKVLVKVNPR